MKVVKQIQEMNLVRLKAATHFSYVKSILEHAEADAVINSKVATGVADLKKAFKVEDDALKVSSKSLVSDKIAQADSERDALYIAYKKAVQNAVGVAAFVEAAAVLWQHIKDYKIDTKAQYDQETGLLDNLITDLEGKYQEQVAKLGLTAYVSALKDANAQVRVLLDQRTEEKIALQVANTKTARAEVDAHYLGLIQMVNSLAVVNGIADYESFIDYVNAQITRYRREALGNKASSSTGEGTGTDNTGSGSSSEDGSSSGSGSSSESGSGTGTSGSGDSGTGGDTGSTGSGSSSGSGDGSLV